MMSLRVKLDEGAFAPERAYELDAGADLRTPKMVTVPARESACIDVGVHVEIPAGYVGMLKSKSGLNTKHGITSTGVIDAGFTGSIVVKLYNHGDNDKVFMRGDKVSQLVIMPVETPAIWVVDEIEGGERGDNGYGSTGI